MNKGDSSLSRFSKDTSQLQTLAKAPGELRLLKSSVTGSYIIKHQLSTGRALYSKQDLPSHLLLIIYRRQDLQSDLSVTRTAQPERS